MEYPDVLIDTSILIEHLRKQRRDKSILYHIASDFTLYAPTIVEFELFAGAIDLQKRRDVESILSWCILLPLVSEVAQQAATIYRNLKAKNQLIEIRDILIAATALTYDLPLMTLNREHFNRIERLRVHELPERSDAES